MAGLSSSIRSKLWCGRLHVMIGSKENWHTPGLEHWSIAVKDGKALEMDWKTEIPICGGLHRACVVVNDRLYFIGGQEGDFMAKLGSPIFKYSHRNEVTMLCFPRQNSCLLVVYDDDDYMLDDDMKWKVLPHMPNPDSHIEFAWAIVNNSFVTVGDTTEKHPVTCWRNFPVPIRYSEEAIVFSDAVHDLLGIQDHLMH